MTRNYSLIIDKSGSMQTEDVNGNSRWKAAEESTIAIASHIAKIDPNGIVLYLFSGNFKRYEGLKDADAVRKAFAENSPMGSTALHLVLADAIAKSDKPETIIVVTDGAPDDRAAVEKVIRDATSKMDSDEQLSIAFFQIGKDGGAQKFLQGLDDDIKGAKFDIVDVKTFDELENIGLEAALLAAIND